MDNYVTDVDSSPEEKTDNLLLIPKITKGEQLGPFGLIELAEAGILAVMRADLKAVREFIKQSAKAENSADVCDRRFMTPFMVACESGKRVVLDLFLQSLPPPDFYKTNEDGFNALHLLSKCGRLDVLYELLTRPKRNQERLRP